MERFFVILHTALEERGELDASDLASLREHVAPRLLFVIVVQYLIFDNGAVKMTGGDHGGQITA